MFRHCLLDYIIVWDSYLDLFLLGIFMLKKRKSVHALSLKRIKIIDIPTLTNRRNNEKFGFYTEGTKQKIWNIMIRNINARIVDNCWRLRTGVRFRMLDQPLKCDI